MSVLFRSPTLVSRRSWLRALVATLVALAALAALGGFAATAHAQQPAPANQPAGGAARRLSLDDALRIGGAQSELIDIARAGVKRATGQQMQARSQALPQLSASPGYTKTLKSQFSGLAATSVDTGPPAPPTLCAPRIPANATQAERDAALAQAITCPAASGGIDFTKTGFGARNQWTLGVQFSQNIYTGGRIQGQTAAANAQFRSANIELSVQRAQAALDVTEAYYDAVLADQLVVIADSSSVQTAEVLRETKLARQVGNQSEFDLLRAQVTYQNQQPMLIQRRSNRQVAYFRLKQLLNIPLDDSLTLTTRIEGANGPSLPAIVTSASYDTAVALRAPVRELEQGVLAQEGLLKVAKSERIPSLALVSAYQRLYFPVGTFPSTSDARQNWTVGISANVPLFTGGRIKGDELVAQAAVDDARARLQQVREFASLDTRVALNALAEADAAWRASAGTADQAQRAYQIDEVRYREGISTQTDLSASRLLLEQSTANRALAARNLAVARVRLTLIRDLPIQAGAANATISGAASGAPAGQAPVQVQTPRSAQQTAGSQANPLGGVQP